MSDIQVIGTVNIAQQGQVTNEGPVTFNFPKNGSMEMGEEPAEQQQLTAKFRYFTPKVYELNMVQPMEDALRAAANGSTSDLRRCIDYLKKEGLINVDYIKESALCEHLNEIYGSKINYEVFRHK